MLIRGFVITISLLALWQAIVLISGSPPFILPSPLLVGVALNDHAGLIAEHALITIIEILIGLGIGILLGIATALLMAGYVPLASWMLPVMVVSQAIPVFALAPLLVLWLGYGMASKIAMAVLIIYFPITAAFHDGLRRVDRGWLDLAATMGAGGAAELRYIRIPAALPALASGVRVATAIAPIGAIIGEWVGSSAGLGYLMLHANARMQIDLMFAALLALAVFAVMLYSVVDIGLRRLTGWQPETNLTGNI